MMAKSISCNLATKQKLNMGDKIYENKFGKHQLQQTPS